MGARFPTSPDAIDTGWLSTVIDAHVRGFDIEPMTDRRGVNGETYRLALDTDTGPPSVVVKLPSPTSRGVAGYQRWYEREVRFYREMATETPLPTPRCLFADIDTNDNFILVLEDLGGERQGSQVEGCSVDEAATVLRAVARMHARWWDPEPAPHPWLPFTTVGLDRGAPVQGAFARAWTRVRDSMPAGALGPIDEGVERYVDLLAEVSAGPVTLCHGDFRLDNLFLAPGGPVVFDWQFTCRARGTYDVAYFLALDLDADLLSAHEDELLAMYLDTLHAAGVSGYTEDLLRRDYAVSLVLSTAVFAIGAAGPQPSQASRLMHEVGLQRLGAAIARIAQRGQTVS